MNGNYQLEYNLFQNMLLLTSYQHSPHLFAFQWMWNENLILRILKSFNNLTNLCGNYGLVSYNGHRSLC